MIDGEDLAITWECIGYCRADRETTIEFSIDADTNVPFDSLDCFAYDLRHDPRRLHQIRPILVGPDSISKKLAVPFLSPLTSQEPFHVLLTCKLPRCMKAGIDYYTATLCFEQERVERCTVRLIFMHDVPQWLRVYEWCAGSEIRLLKDLRPIRRSAASFEYQDNCDDIRAKAARIYIFSRVSTSLALAKRADLRN